MRTTPWVAAVVVALVACGAVHCVAAVADARRAAGGGGDSGAGLLRSQAHAHRDGGHADHIVGVNDRDGARSVPGSSSDGAAHGHGHGGGDHAAEVPFNPSSSAVVRMSSQLGETLSMFENRISHAEGPCDPNDQKSASAAFVMAILFPPAMYLYYGYVVLSIVLLALYLLFLLPTCMLCCACIVDPASLLDQVDCTAVLRMQGDGAGDGAGAAVPPPDEPLSVKQRGRWCGPTNLLDRLMSCQRGCLVLLVAEVLLGAVLLIWQIANVVRIGTGALQPEDGCTADSMKGA